MDCSNKAGAESPLTLEAGKNQERISKSLYTIKERDLVGEGANTEIKKFKVCYF